MVRAGGALGGGARRCAEARGVGMEGEVQVVAGGCVLAGDRSVVPETAGGRVVRWGGGGAGGRREAGTRYIPGWDKDAGGSYSVRDEDASV